VGAGAIPVDAHRRRPPIPIVPVDLQARDAALATGAGPLAAWLAAVAPEADSVRTRVIATSAVEVLRTSLAPPRDGRAMTVGEVALAVDTGRAIAARAGADGVHVLVAAASDAAASEEAAQALAAALTAVEPIHHGPLGALRRLGDAPVAVLCGVALGAGVRGLGCMCHGSAAIVGAAVAAGIEPDLRPRLLAWEDEALAARLGLAVLGPPDAHGPTDVVAALEGATRLGPGPPRARSRAQR